jgi:DNA-binding MarR family transcriptional regulator
MALERGGAAETAPSDPTGGGKDWLTPSEQAVWRRLLAVHARLMLRLDEDLRAATGVSLGDYDVLVALDEAPGRSLRMGDLAQRVMLSPSGLTRRIDRLAARGLASRRDCPSDGRGSLASLTAEGRQLLAAAAPAHVRSVRRYLLTPVGPGALGDLDAALGRICDALDADRC